MLVDGRVIMVPKARAPTIPTRKLVGSVKGVYGTAPCPVGDYGTDERGNAAKPKEGFAMRLLDSNRTVREFSSNAGSVLTAIDALHSAFEAASQQSPCLTSVVSSHVATEARGKH